MVGPSLRWCILTLWACLAARGSDPEVVTYAMSVTAREVPGLLGVEAQGPPSLVVSIHRLGLANRLRHMAAAFVYASDHGWPLVVRWKPARECNATLEDLFDVEKLPFEVFRGNARALDALVGSVSPAAPVGIALPADADEGGVVVVRSAGVRFDVNLTAAGSSRATAVVFDPRGQFATRSVSCHEFLVRKSRFYERLAAAASPDVARAHDRIAAAVGDRLAVGVHVRVDDDRFDWPVVPPQEPGVAGSAAEPWRVGAPASSHFAAARRVLDAHPRAVLDGAGQG